MNIKSKIKSTLLNKSLDLALDSICTWYFRKIKRKKVNIVNIESVRQYIKRMSVCEGGAYHKIESEQKKDCMVYNNLEGKSLYNPIFFPETYIGVVKNATILAASENIFVEGYCLCDRIDDIGDDKWVYPTNNTALMITYSIKKRKALIAAKEPDIMADRAINLVYRFPWGFWHVMNEVLTRMYYVEMYSEYKEWPIIIDAQILDDPMLKKVLECLNINNHEVIQLKQGQTAFVKELLYPSQQMTEQIGNYLPIGFHEATKWWVIQRKEPLEWMRKLVLSAISHKEPYRKVFVMRGKNDRLINEEEVARHLMSRGFECVTMEGMAGEEEIRLFAESKIMIHIHGGAMTNVMWMPSGSRVFQILPGKFMSQNVSYFMMGEYFGFDSYTIEPVIEEDSTVAPLAKYRLELDVLDKAISKFL